MPGIIAASLISPSSIVLAVVIFIGGAQYDDGKIGAELVGLVLSFLPFHGRRLKDW